MSHVLQLVLFLILIGVLGGAYLRLSGESGGGLSWPRDRLVSRLRPRVSTAIGDDEPYYADLSESMASSLSNPRRARATDGQIVSTGSSHVAVASPRDAVIIDAERQFFNSDVNGLLADARRAGKLKVNGPMGIVYVIADEDVPDGKPYLLTAAAARVEWMRRQEQSHQRQVDETRAQFVAGVLGGQEVGGGPGSWEVLHASIDASAEGRVMDTGVPRPAGGWAAAGERGSAGGQAEGGPVQTRPIATIAGTLLPTVPGLSPIGVVLPGLRIGRGPHNGAGTVNVHSVSWDHAEISPGPEGWEVRDAGSKNGTLVNGLKVEVHTLADQDLIGFGRDATYVWTATPSVHPPTG